MASAQAVRLRRQIDAGTKSPRAGGEVDRFVETVFGDVEFLTEDRALEQDLRAIVDIIRTRKWGLYD